MKHRIFSVFTLLLAAAFAAQQAHAQIVIEEQERGGGRGLSDNFFGEVGFTGASGSSHQRTFASIEVGYDGTFAADRGRIFLSAIASHSDIELDLELKSAARDDPNPAAREMTLQEDSSDLDLGDAFVQYDAPGNFVFTAGRARVSWGQFNLVSPVNLALPVTPQSNEASVRKVNLLVPQDQVSFSWFPHERVELQGYHFFSTNIDSLVEEVTRNRGSDRQVSWGDTGRMDMMGNAIMGEVGMDMPTDRLDLTRHSHSAARLMFYPDWGTLGFTYHKGRKALAFSSNLATVHAPMNNNDNVYNVRRHVDFPEADNFGIELAIPAGRWTWKFEMLRQETEVDLEGYSIAMGANPPAGTLANYKTYFDAIVDTNAGKLYIPVDRYIFGIGAESDRDNWRFDFNLFAIDDRFDSQGEELIRLEEAAGFDADRDTLIFPAISVARYIGGSKEREAGVLAGFLGAYFGVSAYYTAAVGDNLRWTAGVEAASSLRDQFLSEREDRYELADDLSAGGRVSLIYSF